MNKTNHLPLAQLDHPSIEVFLLYDNLYSFS